LNATFHDGPVNCSSVSAWLASTSSTSTASRRGVEYVVS